MDTRSVTSYELSDEAKAAINELVRDSGVTCTGIQDGYLVFSTAKAPRQDLRNVANDVSDLISADDVSPEVQDVRSRTHGIKLVWS